MPLSPKPNSRAMRLRPQLRSPWRCLGSGFAAGIGGGAAENATEEEGDEATATVPDGREAGEETIPHLGSRSIWENCSSLQNIDTLSPEEFLQKILETPITTCDQIVWSLIGISMAGWNGIISFLLMILWGYNALRLKGINKT